MEVEDQQVGGTRREQGKDETEIEKSKIRISDLVRSLWSFGRPRIAIVVLATRY
jgi:hypothetical protein